MWTKTAWMGLFCATLLLVRLVHAADFVVNANFNQDGKTYDGETFLLDGLKGTEGVVRGEISNGVVLGSGLQVLGFSDEYSSPNSNFQMRMEGTTVKDSQISFMRKMPENSYIHIISTTGTMVNSKALFKFEGLHLSNKVILLLEGTKVTWEGNDRTGTAVVAFTGNEISSIDHASGLFILNTSAVGSSSIVSSNNINVLTISDQSSMGVDWGSCADCSNAAVVVPQISVSQSSMFRMSHIDVKSQARLISNDGHVSVSGSSLYLVKDSSVDTGSLFDLNSIVVSDNSLVSLVRLKVQGSLLTQGSSIRESTVDTSSRVYGNIKIDGEQLTKDDFERNGLHVNAVITDDERLSDGSCAHASCMPDHFTVSKSESNCGCVCKEDKYQMPACTSVLDSLYRYNRDGRPPCNVRNCWLCAASDPNKCTRCIPDHDLTDDKKCVFVEPTQPPTQKPVATPTPILVPSSRSRTSDDTEWGKNPDCKIEKCRKCTSSNTQCQVCEPGYEVNSDKSECVKSEGTCRVPGPLFMGVVSALAAAALL